METTNTDRICLQVFAKVSAAISHEIKNTLSIINENAGLLDDFAHIAEQTGGVPSERILPITGTITKQVDRSNLLMKNMNMFAHSGDNRLAHANLADVLALVVALAGRQAAMKNLSISVDCPSDIPVFTYLFPFEALIYLTLSTLYNASANVSSVAIKATSEETDIKINFTTELMSGLTLERYPDENQRLLAEELQASCCHHEDNQFLLIVPARIAQNAA